MCRSSAAVMCAMRLTVCPLCFHLVSLGVDSGEGSRLRPEVDARVDHITADVIAKLDGLLVGQERRQVEGLTQPLSMGVSTYFLEESVNIAA